MITSNISLLVAGTATLRVGGLALPGHLLTSDSSDIGGLDGGMRSTECHSGYLMTSLHYCYYYCYCYCYYYYYYYYDYYCPKSLRVRAGIP